jgi:hypothetical protein
LVAIRVISWIVIQPRTNKWNHEITRITNQHKRIRQMKNEK